MAVSTNLVAAIKMRLSSKSCRIPTAVHKHNHNDSRVIERNELLAEENSSFPIDGPPIFGFPDRLVFL